MKYSVIALSLLLLLGSGCIDSAEPGETNAQPVELPGAQTEEVAEQVSATPLQTGQGDNQVSITVDEAYRYITSNGLPNHETGDFPNPGNPNTISVQPHEYRMPLNPRPATSTTPLELGAFGVAVNGIPFDPGAAEYWNNDRNSGWQYEALSGVLNLGLDQNNAHVQPTGAYHYHGLPTGLLGAQDSTQHSALVGYAADGFPIYALYSYEDANDPSSAVTLVRSSYRVKNGTRPSGPGGAYDGTYVADYEYVPGEGDLDACNGRSGVTPEYPDGTYYYVITDSFPFIPRCFTGTPDESFSQQGAGQGPGALLRGPGRQPPSPRR